LGFELAHIGINTESAVEAAKAAKMLELMFGFAPRETPVSIFAGDQIEVMRPPHFGTHGHVGIFTVDVVRAQAFLEGQGFEFNPESLRTNPEGVPVFIYFKDELAGFAMHLLQK